MNTEEKARRYDEALNWMREIYPGLHGATKEDAEHFFPELAESEDERIREEIVDYFKKECECLLNDFRDKEDEKQLSFYKKALAWLEKQKEQKPLTTEETELNSIAFLEQMGYTCIPPRKEQNPAEWSEEDEATIGTLINYFEGDALDCSTDEIIRRIRALRPSWKPSEEQMEALEHFIRCWGESGTMSPQNTILCAAQSLLRDLKKLM